MRRRIATLAAMSVFVLALSAAPALAGSPVIRGSVPAAESGSISCGSNTYTFQEGGSFDWIMHFVTSASGNTTFRATYRASNAMVADQHGNLYRVVGAEPFGGTVNAKTGVSQGITVFKFQVVGTADSLNVVLRQMPNGDFNVFGPGTCPVV
jgi:hypothetical protein